MLPEECDSERVHKEDARRLLLEGIAIRHRAVAQPLASHEEVEPLIAPKGSARETDAKATPMAPSATSMRRRGSARALHALATRRMRDRPRLCHLGRAYGEARRAVVVSGDVATDLRAGAVQKARNTPPHPPRPTADSPRIPVPLELSRYNTD